MDSTARLADPRLTRVVLVANQKGGVGKSSIVSALAGMIASPQHRVLVVDGDQQGNATRNDLGVEGDRGRALAMALQYAQPLEPEREVRPGLDVIAGGPLLAGVAAASAAADQTGIDLTANLTDTLGSLCDREKYALVLIDSGPGDAALLDVFLGLARYLLVPSCDDEASYDGVSLLATRYLRATQRGAAIDLLGVVLFNVNPRARVRNQQALDALTELLAGSGASAFTSIIRTDKATAIDLRRQHLTPGELVEVSRRDQRARLQRLGTGKATSEDAPGGATPAGERLWSRDPSALANDYQGLAREVLSRVAAHEGRHGPAAAGEPAATPASGAAS